ncbi:MAG: threonylcarbamoyl-AMP synthase [Gammaproteobacteria bacterium]|nr:threonylcarbamoyl-AMP synthase [Gammaproteobacteria bacterium]
MSQFFQIHSTHPQPRLIRRTVELVDAGGLIAYPTDSGYALGCHIGDKSALDRIRRIRQVDKQHNFTLVCRDLGEISTYAKFDNSHYRILKAHTPGAYTFILPATREVPRRLQHPKRKTIGIRVPDNLVALAILEALNQPLMSSSLILPGDSQPMSDPYVIREQLEHMVDVVIDAGVCPPEPTTVVDLTGDVPVLARRGGGDMGWLSS